MVQVLLIRPGATTFDVEGRIKGSLDIPLSEQGEAQARNLARMLADEKLDCLYVAPAESARQSAEFIAERNFVKQKSMDCLRNLDHGLWQGKLVSEVKRLQPRVYRQFQEHPTEVCPPGGETVMDAVGRVRRSVEKLVKKHKHGRIGILVPQPLASIVKSVLTGADLGDLWKSELDFGTYESVCVESRSALIGSVALT